MRILIRLAAADQERLDAPEELAVDPYSVTFQETVVLQKGVEIEGAVCSFDSANDWRTSFGKNDAFALIVLVWLGLRRAGIKVPLGEVDASERGMSIDVERDPADPGEPGKDPSGPTTTS